MTIRLLEREFPTDRLPLLRWLMFTGVTAFGFVIAWHYGLFPDAGERQDLYFGADHGSLRGDHVALPHPHRRDLARADSAQRVFALVSRGTPDLRVVGSEVVTSDGVRLPPGRSPGISAT